MLRTDSHHVSSSNRRAYCSRPTQFHCTVVVEPVSESPPIHTDRP